MYAELFLRIFADCCVFFAFLGCCPSLLPYSFPLPAAAVICAVAAALSSFLWEKGYKALGRCCALLPLLSLLLAPNPWEMLILVVPVLYTVATMLRGGLYQEYFNYRSYFTKTLAILLFVWMLLSVTVYFEDPTGMKEKVVFPEKILPYALTYFLCGIVLQRLLRLGHRDAANGGAGQIVGMVASVGTVTLGVVLTEPYLRQEGGDGLRAVLGFLFSPVTIVVDLIAYFLKLLELMRMDRRYLEELKNSDAEMGERPSDYQEYMNQILESRPDEGRSPWVMVLAALAVLVVLVLMILAFTRMRAGRADPMAVSEMKDKEKKQRVSRLSNRGRVRQSYREFIRQERVRGLKLKKQDTTWDILQRISKDTDEAAAADLREIYIAARYDDTREVTKAQADAARAAVRKSANGPSGK